MGARIVLRFASVYYFIMPVAEVATVRRGTGLSAVYGNAVRIVAGIRGACARAKFRFIQLAEPFAAGRGAIGKPVEKGQLLATIADETTARQVKQARRIWKPRENAPSCRFRPRNCSRAAEDNLERLRKGRGFRATCRRSNTKKRRAKRTV